MNTHPWFPFFTFPKACGHATNNIQYCSACYKYYVNISKMYALFYNLPFFFFLNVMFLRFLCVDTWNSSLFILTVSSISMHKYITIC